MVTPSSVGCHGHSQIGRWGALLRGLTKGWAALAPGKIWTVYACMAEGVDEVRRERYEYLGKAMAGVGTIMSVMLGNA